MKKAYFCIDGFSFKRINDFYRYEHKRHSRLNIASMETFLRYEMTRRLDWNCSPDNLDIEKHYYHPSDANNSMLKFEEKLTDCGYNIHYSQRANALKPRPNPNIFPDWLIAMELRKYDIFILLTTQGQFSGAFRITKRYEIKTMLIGWDSPCMNSTGWDTRWKTDKDLIGYANIYCPLEKMLNRSDCPFADAMFEKFYPNYPSSLLYG